MWLLIILSNNILLDRIINNRIGKWKLKLNYIK